MTKLKQRQTRFRLAGWVLGLSLAALLGIGAGLLWQWFDRAVPLEADGRPSGLRYDSEYPAVPYSTAPLTGRVGVLQRRLASGAATLSFDAGRGYLDELLAALEIDVSSQVLVFSRTSLQVETITPQTPRAIYFNDDSYVAWVQGAANLEVASMDPQLGQVFHTLAQDPDAAPRFERRLGLCLRCHDTYGLTGGGVPRFLLGSGYIDTAGELVSHEGWILTSDRTPLRSRWGGWYVSGYHGSDVHLGNIAVNDAAELQQLEQLRTGNLQDLDAVLNTEKYLTNYSDVIALLVLEHQIGVQNLITRVNYESRMLLYESQSAGSSATPPSIQTRIAEIAEPLVDAMLFADAVGLEGPYAGTSGFSSYFESLGPTDSKGRSLREFDLSGRLFRYPLSYLIYSAAFDALPEEVKRYLYGRFEDVLRDEGRDGRFAQLAASDTAAILEILAETKPGFGGYGEVR